MSTMDYTLCKAAKPDGSGFVNFVVETRIELPAPVANTLTYGEFVVYHKKGEYIISRRFTNSPNKGYQGSHYGYGGIQYHNQFISAIAVHESELCDTNANKLTRSIFNHEDSSVIFIKTETGNLECFRDIVILNSKMEYHDFKLPTKIYISGSEANFIYYNKYGNKHRLSGYAYEGISVNFPVNGPTQNIERLCLYTRDYLFSPSTLTKPTHGDFWLDGEKYTHDQFIDMGINDPHNISESDEFVLRMMGIRI